MSAFMGYDGDSGQDLTPRCDEAMVGIPNGGSEHRVFIPVLLGRELEQELKQAKEALDTNIVAMEAVFKANQEFSEKIDDLQKEIAHHVRTISELMEERDAAWDEVSTLKKEIQDAKDAIEFQKQLLAKCHSTMNAAVYDMNMIIVNNNLVKLATECWEAAQ